MNDRNKKTKQLKKIHTNVYIYDKDNIIIPNFELLTFDNIINPDIIKNECDLNFVTCLDSINSCI